MQKLGEVWFVKHIPSRRFFEFSNTLGILWECLLSTQSINDAKEKFERKFPSVKEVGDDFVDAIKQLEKYGLLNNNNLRDNKIVGSNSASHTLNDIGSIQKKMASISRKTNRPLLAEYEMTYRCNLRCVYCYQPNYLKHAKINELTKEEITVMLQDFSKSGLFFFNVTGGECTLMPNFPHVIEEARKLHLDLTVLTNATAIKPHILDLFSEYEISEIKVSIYGSSAETYKKFTGFESGFNKVVNNLKKMKEANLNVTGKIIVTSYQEKEYKETVRLLQDLDINIEVNSHIMPAMDGDLYPLEFRPQSSTLKELMETGYIDIEGGCRACTAGTLKFRITPDGSVNACELTRETLGNIRQGNILDILNSSKSKSVKNEVWQAIKSQDKEKVWALPCPAIGKMEEGSWVEPSKEAMRWTNIAIELKEHGIA